MNRAIKYIRENSLGILIAIGVVSFIVESFVLKGHLGITQYIVFAIFIYSQYLKIKDEKLKHAYLKKKGLTPEDVANIKFVKEWEVVRQEGFIKYALFNGGLITGMIFLIPLSFCRFLISNEISFNNFSSMMYFIIECFFISYGTGVIIYFIRGITINVDR